ncbi:MAG: NUDIX domain-containing protein [Actinobacteria bacterium]|nr:NUDIX domain-containing protein [Actinomycetota bacterium]
MNPRPNIRVSGLVHHSGRFLLVRQERGGSGYWLLPGGAVERGETLAAALEREIEEECGLRVRVADAPIGLVETISPDGGLTRHLIQVVLLATPVSPEGDCLTEPPTPVAGDPAIRGLCWATADESLGLDLHPPIHDLLQAWLDELGSRSTDTPMTFRAAGRRWADE